VPAPLTAFEWNLNARLEGVLMPLQKLTLQTEGDVPVADMELLFVKRCMSKLSDDSPLTVPKRNSGFGRDRKFEKIPWSAVLPPIKLFGDVVLAELKRRHFGRTPSKSAMILMCLNPSLQIEKILPEGQVCLAKTVFRATWDEASCGK